MPARRKKSYLQGKNKNKDGVIWHREHRSKKNRRKIHWGEWERVRRYKEKKRRQKEMELQREALLICKS